MVILGAFCDLVWSDPEEVDAWAVSPRGAGWLFGSNVTNDFMHTNHLKLICRAHQLVHEGKKHWNFLSLSYVSNRPCAIVLYYIVGNLLHAVQEKERSPRKKLI